MNSYEDLIDLIENGINFSWSRWGDGEWNAVLGKKGNNCDKHQYFSDMGLKLKSILESKPEYYLGLQNLAKRQNSDKEEFQRLTAINIFTGNEYLHHASSNGVLSLLLNALKGRHVVMVGNSSLRKLELHNDFVEIPLVDCWKSYEKTKKQIKELIRKDVVILYSASMMTNVLIDDFHDKDITQIDCGSVFDPYVGRNTRSYHKNLNLKK